MSRWYDNITESKYESTELYTTKDEITSVSAKSSKSLLITLMNGTAVLKNDDKTEEKTPKDEKDQKEKFIGSCVFNGNYYILSEHAIFKVDADALAKVKEIKEKCTQIAATNEIMVVATEENKTLVFDEELQEVKTLEFPDINQIRCNGTLAAFAIKKGVEVITGKACESKDDVYFNNGVMKTYGESQSVCVTKDDKYIVVGNEEGRINCLEKNEAQFVFYAHCDKKENKNYKVTAINSYNDGYILTTGEDGMINVFNLDKKEVITSIVVPKSQILNALISEDKLIFIVKSANEYKVSLISIEPLLEVAPQIAQKIQKKRGRKTNVERAKTKKEKMMEEEESPKKLRPRRGRKAKKEVIEEVSDEEEESLEYSSEEEDSYQPEDTDSEDDRVKHKTRGRKAKREVTVVKKGTSGKTVKILGNDRKVEKTLKKEISKKGLFTLTGMNGKADVVVSDDGKRTIEIIDSLVQGLPIVSKDYIKESHKADKALPVTQYLMKDKFPGVKGSVNEKLFENKTVAIFGELKIRDPVIRKWVEQLGGELIARIKNANYVLVGLHEFKCDATRRTDGFAVKEEWLYDCISEMKLLSPETYLVDGEFKEEKEKLVETDAPAGDKKEEATGVKKRKETLKKYKDKKEAKEEKLKEHKETTEKVDSKTSKEEVAKEECKEEKKEEPVEEKKMEVEPPKEETKLEEHKPAMEEEKPKPVIEGENITAKKEEEKPQEDKETTTNKEEKKEEKVEKTEQKLEEVKA
ncbi:hypothetical protein EIN_023450 [Entamoeba invadens IP1]|uniref:hypothetical protein n=1 Tax=Entamoeba invadens IP1 TaxID=370355 RepID=UPI0002C3F70D|nr:hypothetical protein EIN_023450 [Entamoeba invadens IP1]ELP90656.1 hypothetical protein EIN_023450 [Entamoeba invadens IP1]|eukprot:XP_004257427.1 hypothetical protein EIN_023450 [Entamoeba invadens IP1]